MEHPPDLKVILEEDINGMFSKQACILYWKVITLYLVDKEQVDKTLKDSLDNLFNNYA